MKVLALVLLVVAGTQARSAPVASNALAALGENPSVVHFRTAVTTSGLLRSCIGSLISNQVILTSSSCVQQSSFIWLRFDATEVIRPELVLESNSVFQAGAGLARVVLARFVESTANVAPIELADENEVLPEVAKVCVFGATQNGGPGENLKCLTVKVTADGSELVAHVEDGEFSDYDVGAALVAGGKQIGVLVAVNEAKDVARFVRVSQQLNLLNSQAAELTSQEEGTKVVVVNN